MYELEITKHFSKVPIFRFADAAQIIQNRQYAKKFLSRMVKENKVFKVKKDYYTLYDDPFLISTFLIKPSYISSVSALGYHRLITQISREVFCFTTKASSSMDFFETVNFIHTRHFFGFEMKPYGGFAIPIATPEKAVIDSISAVPLSVVEEAFESLDKKAMVNCLKKINKPCIAKRIGCLMEKHGHDVYSELKGCLNYRRIFLDPLGRKNGKLNRKWGVIDNT
ncbi:MAG: hypothetical protein ABIB71_06970 [Candidatus Woesearchaeota archaeon]